MDEFELREQEYRELNNELVVPQYNAFCKHLGLTGLLTATTGRESGRSRLDYHNEAMNLFNRLKPEYVAFKQQVVRYQFTEWGGRFEFQATPTNVFLDETADRLYYLQGLEKRFLRVRAGLALSVTIGVFAGLAVAVGGWLSPQYAWIATLPEIGLALAAGSWVDRRLAQVPQIIGDDGRFRDVAARLRTLQDEAARVSEPGANRRHAKLAPDVDASDDELLKWVSTVRARVFGSGSSHGGV